MFNINNTSLIIWITVINIIFTECSVGGGNASIWKLRQGDISCSIMTNRKENNSLLAFLRHHFPALVTHPWGSLWTLTRIAQTVTFPFQKLQATAEAPKRMSFIQSFSRCFLVEHRKRSQIILFLYHWPLQNRNQIDKGCSSVKT